MEFACRQAFCASSPNSRSGRGIRCRHLEYRPRPSQTETALSGVPGGRICALPMPLHLVEPSSYLLHVTAAPTMYLGAVFFSCAPRSMPPYVVPCEVPRGRSLCPACSSSSAKTELADMTNTNAMDKTAIDALLIAQPSSCKRGYLCIVYGIRQDNT